MSEYLDATNNPCKGHNCDCGTLGQRIAKLFSKASRLRMYSYNTSKMCSIIFKFNYTPTSHHKQNRNTGSLFSVFRSFTRSSAQHWIKYLSLKGNRSSLTANGHGQLEFWNRKDFETHLETAGASNSRLEIDKYLFFVWRSCRCI